MAACLASNSGSGLLPHQYSVLWGRSLPALRMRCTVVAERPLACARSLTLQEVLPCRGVLVARSTTERRCAAVMLAGRPGRCSSASPSRRLSRKRRFHLKTLIWLSPDCSPTALMGSPCAQQRMTFARRESLCSVVPARVHMRRVCSSSAVSSIRRAVAMNSLLRCTECDHLMRLLYYNTLEECNTSGGRRGVPRAFGGPDDRRGVAQLPRGQPRRHLLPRPGRGYAPAPGRRGCRPDLDRGDARQPRPCPLRGLQGRDALLRQEPCVGARARGTGQRGGPRGHRHDDDSSAARAPSLPR